MEIPETWRLALRTIQRVHPDAIIAGGALRDLDHGYAHLAKDLDIFVQGSPKIAVLANELGVVLHAVVQEASADYIPSMSDVASVYEAHVSGLPILNIIGLTMPATPARVLERIDLGLCRVAYDGELVYYGNGYHRDRANRTMTILRADNEQQRSRSLQRYLRLSEKYVGYSLVDFMPGFNLQPWEITCETA